MGIAVLLLQGISIIAFASALGRADSPEVRRLVEEGRFVEAEGLGRRLLAEAEAAHGPDSGAVADVLEKLVEALYLGGKGRDPECRVLADRGVAIRERLYGPEDPRLALSLQVLGRLLFELADYRSAASAFERVIAIFSKAEGPESLGVARGLNGLGMVLGQSGDVRASKERFEQALAIRERVFGPNHTNVAQTLNNVAITTVTLGDYAAARRLFTRSLEILEAAHGPEHPLVGASRNSLGDLLLAMGDYAGAQARQEEALAIRERSLGSEHPEVAGTLDSLGILGVEMGDFARAQQALERSIAIKEKALGPDHPDLGMPLETLGTALASLGDYARARHRYERALSVREKGLGPDHPLVAATMERLGLLRLREGDASAARTPCEKSLAIREKVLGPEHPLVADSLTSLAEVFLAKGDFAAARALHERALAIREKVLGADHPSVAVSLTSLALLLLEAGDGAAALTPALSAEDVSREHFRLTARVLAERQALAYAASRSAGLPAALTVARRGASTESLARVWNAVILSRSLVLDEMASRHRDVASGDSAVRKLAADLVSARQRLANLRVRGAGELRAPSYRKLLDDAHEEHDRAERALAQKSATFRREQARSRHGFATVAKAVTPRSALVAYVRVEADPERKAKSVEGAYVGFLLRGGESSPEVFDLGSSERIDTLVGAWRDTMTPDASSPAAKAYRRVGEELRRAIWDPIARRLGAPERVFVVPDGTLHLVSLAALPTVQDRYLIEDGPLIHHLSTERDLVPDDAPPPQGQGLLALGGPDFDDASMFASLTPPSAPGTAGSPGSGSERPAPRVADGRSGFRGPRSGCGDFGSIRFATLPSAASEVRTVGLLWSRARRGEPASLLIGRQAGESAFKAKAQGARALHLATHGFFLGERCLSALASRRGIGGLVHGPPTVRGENPLLLSGLVLAGANNRAVARPDEDDGILTAEEIASLDLNGVDWVVLSACDTGVGTIKAGEGVFGLRRAFRVAGARALVMSLWAVEDDSAQRWTEAFYEARLLGGLGTAASAHRASLAVLRARRAARQATHPFHWAGFVAAGDWR